MIARRPNQQEETEATETKSSVQVVQKVLSSRAQARDLTYDRLLRNPLACGLQIGGIPLPHLRNQDDARKHRPARTCLNPILG